MTVISANELKRKGVSAFESALKDDSELMISVHGKTRYVVMNMDAYSRLRDNELQMALDECRREIKEGRYVVESVAKHVQRVTR